MLLTVLSSVSARTARPAWRRARRAGGGGGDGGGGGGGGIVEGVDGRRRAAAASCFSSLSFPPSGIGVRLWWRDRMVAADVELAAELPRKGHFCRPLFQRNPRTKVAATFPGSCRAHSASTDSCYASALRGHPGTAVRSRRRSEQAFAPISMHPLPVSKRCTRAAYRSQGFHPTMQYATNTLAMPRARHAATPSAVHRVSTTSARDGCREAGEDVQRR